MRPLRRAALALTLLVAGCGTLGQQLGTAQKLYADARYEEALEWLVELEREVPDMDEGEVAQFYYLRGMTAHRLGQQDDALHFLALAEVADDRAPGSLSQARRVVMERTLLELMPRDASPHARNPLRPDTL